MSSTRVIVAIVTIISAMPLGARAQVAATGSSTADGIDGVDDVLVPLGVGTLAGGMLAIAVVAPDTTVSPWSDGPTSLVAITPGVVLALLANATARTRFPGRLRATAGSTTSHDWEYALAYRASLTTDFAIEVAGVVSNDSWTLTQRMTMCTFFGKFTGDYIVDSRDEQMVAALARAVYEPFQASSWRPSLAIGGGPSHAHSRYLDPTTALTRWKTFNRTGAVFDAMISLERWWMTADFGLRVGTMDAVIGNETAVYFRFGYTFGERKTTAQR